MSGRRALTSFRAPDESVAEARTWDVVRSAHRARVPVPRRSLRPRPAVALAAVVLVGAAALSPAGATVGRLITRAIGVQHAAPALLSLPAPGRLLVSGAGGTWTVAADGSTRRLGTWPHASWSPHGRYVTLAGGDRLVAVDPRGTAQWALSRPAVSDPRWHPPDGYRVAYLSRHDLRVVAGDGTGDHLLAARVAAVAPAWRPAHPYQLAYLTARGRLVVRDADTGRTLWSARPGPRTDQLAWSTDGRRLLALSATGARVYAGGGAVAFQLALARRTQMIDGALSPDGRALALVNGGGVEVVDLGVARPAPRHVLAGAGLRQVEWSPDGNWLLVSWPAADQWVFVRVDGAPRIAAVSRIAQQFSAPPRRGFPQLEGWCCTASSVAR